MTLRTSCLLAAALLLTGCLFGSRGFSVCRAEDEANVALRPDADIAALRELFAKDGWTVAPKPAEGRDLDAAKTWNETLGLKAYAWHFGYVNVTGQTNYTMVRLVGEATTHTKYDYSVATLEAPLIAKLRDLAASDDAAPTIPTRSAASSWSCIHGD